LCFRDEGLVAAGGRAQCFVERGDGYDREEGDYQASCGADVPPAEDYAEVLCVPGEEHLQFQQISWGLWREGFEGGERG